MTEVIRFLLIEVTVRFELTTIIRSAGVPLQPLGQVTINSENASYFESRIGAVYSKLTRCTSHQQEIINFLLYAQVENHDFPTFRFGDERSANWATPVFIYPTMSKNYCASGELRSHDSHFKRVVLYQLSYKRINKKALSFWTGLNCFDYLKQLTLPFFTILIKRCTFNKVTWR